MYSTAFSGNEKSRMRVQDLVAVPPEALMERRVEPSEGFEPPTDGLSMLLVRSSTAELRGLCTMNKMILATESQVVN